MRSIDRIKVKRVKKVKRGMSIFIKYGRHRDLMPAIFVLVLFACTVLRMFGILAAAFSPTFTLLQPFPVIPLLFIISELVQQIAGEIAALPAMFMPFCFSAGFHRAAFAPKWFFNIYASFTPCLCLIRTFAA